MQLSRGIAALSALVGLAVPVAFGGAAIGADLRDGAAAPWGETLDRTAHRDGGFTGVDGVHHDNAPLVVDGLDGEMFYGVDFDVACAFGDKYVRGMRNLAKLARVIERSGRRVVWTVAPSKTSVLADKLDLSTVPHGQCTRRGLRQQAKLLDSYSDPSYLPLRSRLAGDPRQVFWKTDPHWTTVGGAVFAKQLAKALDPALGKRQRYRLGQETGLGAFTAWRGDDTPETWQSAYPDTRVSVRTARASKEDFTAFPDIVFDHSWTSRPAKRVWPGRTLIVGDSMGLLALENLRPVFRHGRFMWVIYVDDAELVSAIVDADTVVLEAFQTFLPLYPGLGSATLRRAVAAALRQDADRARPPSGTEFSWRP